MQQTAAGRTWSRYRAVGLLLSLGAALSFAVGIIFSKRLTDGDLPIPFILALRFGLAALVLLLIARLAGQLALTRRQLGLLLVLGGLGYGGEAGLYFLGLENGSATAVTLIFYSYPAIVTVAAAVLGREPLRAFAVVALAVTSLGIILLVLPGGGVSISTAGVVFSLGAAVVFSCYLILGEGVLSEVSALTGAAMTVLGASLFHACIVAGGGLVERPDSAESLRLVAVAACTVVAFIGLIGGLRRLGATESAVVLTVEPLAAAVLAAIFLDDSLTALQALGGALVLAGVALRALGQPGQPRIETVEEAAPV
jgi:drug/metabolite transporter (DMT)-like permease